MAARFWSYDYKIPMIYRYISTLIMHFMKTQSSWKGKVSFLWHVTGCSWGICNHFPNLKEGGCRQKRMSKAHVHWISMQIQTCTQLLARNQLHDIWRLSGVHAACPLMCQPRNICVIVPLIDLVLRKSKTFLTLNTDDRAREGDRKRWRETCLGLLWEKLLQEKQRMKSVTGTYVAPNLKTWKA